MNTRFLKTALLSLAVTACGGGNGGGTPPAQPLAITAANGDLVTAVVIDDLTAVQELGGDGLELGGPGTVLGVQIDVADNLRFAPLALGSALLDRIAPTLGNGTAVGVILTETFLCDITGSFTLRLDAPGLTEGELLTALDNGTIPAGLSLRVTFSNCNDTLLELVANGGFTITYLTAAFFDLGFDGLPDPGTDDYVLDVQFDFDALQLGGSGIGSGRIDGDLRLLVDSFGDGTYLTEAAGSQLFISSDANEVALSDFLVTSEVNNTSLTYSTSYDMEIDNSLLDGSVTVTSLQPFVGTFLGDTLDYPFQGSLEITGAGGSNVVLTVIAGGALVQIDVDADGNGIPEFLPSLMTWEDLDLLSD